MEYTKYYTTIRDIRVTPFSMILKNTLVRLDWDINRQSDSLYPDLIPIILITLSNNTRCYTTFTKSDIDYHFKRIEFDSKEYQIVDLLYSI